MLKRLLVFDWDGTIVDSEARIVNCVLRAASDLGLGSCPKREISKRIGISLDRVIPELFPSVDMQRFLPRYQELYFYEDTTPIGLFPGVRETLKELLERGHILAVATGKSRRGLNLALEENALGEFFQITKTADETASKPDPRMLLEILDELGLERDFCQMLGDSIYDMQMAQHAKVERIAVSYGVHSKEELLAFEPIAILSNFSSLLSLMLDN